MTTEPQWLLVPADSTLPLRLVEDYGFLADMDRTHEGYNSRATMIARNLDDTDRKLRYGDVVFYDEDDNLVEIVNRLGMKFEFELDGEHFQIQRVS